MKKMKLGFTLAEVLITLGIIGVIAALVMPSVMSNYTYKTVGVKIGKFASQLEAATRPYVINYGNLGNGTDELAEFVRESFLLVPSNFTSNESVNATLLTNATNATRSMVDLGANTTADGHVFKLKDGTAFAFYNATSTAANAIGIANNTNVGAVSFGVVFFPEVQGLPAQVQKGFNFIVTELGYVFPDASTDKCIDGIKEDGYVTNPRTFKYGTACGSPANNNTFNS